MLFSNVNKIILENCTFIADLASELEVTNLDLYNGCKNVLVNNCKFINMTKADSGGCIWVRNLTSDEYGISGNDTEDILIKNSTFIKDSKDEVIAVFSNRGHVKNITIKDNLINDYSEKNQIVLSTFSSDNSYYGTVSDVTIDNNKIYSKNFQAFIILIGKDKRKNETSNVKIVNNTITAEGINDIRKVVINVGDGNVNNVLVENNTINAKNMHNATAIRNAYFVRNNTIDGDLKYGVIKGNVVKNIIRGADVGILSPKEALENTITNCRIGISSSPGKSKIVNNTVILNRNNGLGGIEVTGKVLDGGNILCSGNNIFTVSHKQIGFIIHSGSIILSGNNVFGSGKYKYSTKSSVITQY